MTDISWDDRYKSLVRTFIAQHGDSVCFEEPQYNGDDCVSFYGWRDYSTFEHVNKLGKTPACKWVVPEGAELSEVTYSQFAGTFTDADQEVGVNVSGAHCACGKYTDITLRWTGTVTDMLHSILGLPDARLSITL